MTTAQYFQGCVEGANPPDQIIDVASQGHQLIREALAQLPDRPRSFLTGSYGRRTHNNPLNDVDIFLVFESKSDEEARALLRTVEDHLRWFLPRIALMHNNVTLGFEVRLQEKSVGVTIRQRAADGLWHDWPMSFDVIPAVAMDALPTDLNDYDGGFRIAHSGLNAFIATYPLEAKRALQAANLRCDPLIPLIKLLKRMNAAFTRPDPYDNNRLKKPLKSFHLEVMCYSADIGVTGDGQSDRQRFFKLLVHLYTKCSDRTLLPPRGGSPLASYFDSLPPRPWLLVDVEQWLMSCARVALGANREESAGNHGQAIALWSQLRL
jgi:hypothetical protein